MSELIESLVHELIPQYTQWGDWCASPRAYFRGKIHMPSTNYHVGFSIYKGEIKMEEPHIHQGAEEYLIFMGAHREENADLPDLFDFDAEIELMMGDDPDHMEVYTINKPTIVRIPPNVWHCPITFKKITKPIMFQAAFLDGTWGTIVRRKDAEGNNYYVYNGNDVRYCRYNPEEKCVYCGRCFGAAAKATKEE